MATKTIELLAVSPPSRGETSRWQSSPDYRPTAPHAKKMGMIRTEALLRQKRSECRGVVSKTMALTNCGNDEALNQQFALS